MKLAIVGSRNFRDWAQFNTGVEAAIGLWGAPDEIVSGGAAGADTMATRWATEHGVTMVVYRANWAVHGRAAGPIRNRHIVARATHVLAFPNHLGRGTQHAIGIARAAKKPLIIFDV
jgi:hypothetical protein